MPPRERLAAAHRQRAQAQKDGYSAHFVKNVKVGPESSLSSGFTAKSWQEFLAAASKKDGGCVVA